MRKKIGNVLIVFSLIFGIFIYYPYFLAYFPAYTPGVQAQSNESAISIPKINAQATIIEDVDPSSPAGYKKALQHGVAQAKGFAKVGEKGLVYIFAHSSLPPWEMTRTNTAFLRLGELQNGDLIILSAPCHPERSEESVANATTNQLRDSSPGARSENMCHYQYQVFNKMELWPSQTEIFNQERDKDELILQTCTPVGTDLKRLLVFAKPI